MFTLSQRIVTTVVFGLAIAVNAMAGPRTMLKPRRPPKGQIWSKYRQQAADQTYVPPAQCMIDFTGLSVKATPTAGSAESWVDIFVLWTVDCHDAGGSGCSPYFVTYDLMKPTRTGVKDIGGGATYFNGPQCGEYAAEKIDMRSVSIPLNPDGTVYTVVIRWVLGTRDQPGAIQDTISTTFKW